LAKPGVTKAARGFLDSFFPQRSLGGGIQLMEMKLKAKRPGQVRRELLVTIRFAGSQTVVEMGGVYDNA
jgi:hypothetical protein